MDAELLKGHYWKTGDKEYNVQITFNPVERPSLMFSFRDWTKVAEGVIPGTEEEIHIFRKIFDLRSEFLNLVKELKRKQIILLKEAK
tara:strand:- start:594 stop:854 length:261 start_codon:yes stop_codon:yes gene_type:complete